MNFAKEFGMIVLLSTVFYRGVTTGGGRGGRLGGHGPPLHFNFRTKKGPTVSISEVIVAFKCGPLAKTEKQAVIKTGPTEKLL